MQRNIVIFPGDGFITTNIFMLLISSSKCDMFYDVPWFYIHISFLLFLENKNKKEKKNSKYGEKNVECCNNGFTWNPSNIVSEALPKTKTKQNKTNKKPHLSVNIYSTRHWLNVINCLKVEHLICIQSFTGIFTSFGRIKSIQIP